MMISIPTAPVVTSSSSIDHLKGLDCMASERYSMTADELEGSTMTIYDKIDVHTRASIDKDDR